MKKVIVIGAGIAGLTAGIYARRQGLDVEILELHNQPGGECTGWNRGDYHFDGCIHWMMGMRPGSGLYEIWQDTGALSADVVGHFFDSFFSVTDGSRTMHLYTDIDRLEAHLLDLSPQDADLIRSFCRSIRKFKDFDQPVGKPYDLMKPLDGLKMGGKMLPYLGDFRRLNQTSIEDYCQQFKDPLIRRGLKGVIPPEYAVIGLITTLSSLSSKDSGWPMGGSLALAKRMEETFVKLGGTIQYRARVARILIEQGRVIGVETTTGKVFNANVVISCADGHATLHDMLEGRYLDNPLAEMLANLDRTPITPPTLLFSAGIAADLSHRPHMTIYELDEPLSFAGKEYHEVPVRHYCYDPGLAPDGHSVVNMILYTDYDWWRGLADRAAYRQEKAEVQETLAGLLEEMIPEASGKIVVTDLATPLTYERYCNAWRGAWMSFLLTPGFKQPNWNGRIEELEGFYMGGMWTNFPGGLPGAAIGGRWAVQRLCHDYGLPFKAGFIP